MSLDPKIQEWINEAEALIYEQGLMGWRNWVYGEPLDLARTYKGHEKLFTPETIDAVSRAAEATEDELLRRALVYFRNHLIGEYISKEVAGLDDSLQNLQAEATVAIGGELVPYRQLSVLLANEADYDRRGLLSDTAVPVLRELNPIFEEKVAVSQRLAQTLGFDGYVSLAEELRHVDLDHLEALCRRFVEETEPLYLKLLPEMTERLAGVELQRFRRADVARMLKLVAFDQFFPSQTLLPVVREFLRGLGVNLDHQPNVLIDDAQLPKKNPRAVCFPLRVPSEIRVSVKPVGGAADYEALFHEMGHAQHYAHTDVPYFPLQQLGNATATESYAFLFEGTVGGDSWLQRFTTMSARQRKEFRRFRVFLKLFFVRRYCAKLSYELHLHRGLPNPKEAYRQLLGKAYGFALSDEDVERYRSDVDDWFYTADYLRAWFVEARLSAHLSESFGTDWFRSPEAGAWLKQLWSHGNAWDGEELLATIGAGRVDSAALKNHLEDELDNGGGSG